MLFYKSPGVNFKDTKLITLPLLKTTITPAKQIIVAKTPYLLIFSLNKKKENKIMNIGEAE